MHVSRKTVISIEDYFSYEKTKKRQICNEM